VHPLDDVTALAELAQRRLGPAVDHPLAGADLFSETKRFELAKPPDLQRVILVGPDVRIGRHVDDASLAAIANKLPIELGPALRLDLALQIAADVEIGARPQFLRDEIGGAGAHPFLDVVTRDDEILPIVGAPAQDDMDVRVVGVPVIDRRPIELRAEILCHLAHQVAGEGFEVRHVDRVFRRYDEAEMMPVVLASLGEAAAVDVISLRPEQPGLLPVAGDALAAQVAEMGGKWRGARVMANEPGLDDDDARTSRQQSIGAHARRPAAPEGRAVAGADPAGARDTCAGLLRGSERLSDEGSGPLRAGGTDTARPDAKIVVAAHGRAPTHRAKGMKSRRNQH